MAHSRLWDAVIGFLHVFAHMMMKLAQVNTEAKRGRLWSPASAAKDGKKLGHSLRVDRSTLVGERSPGRQRGQENR